MLPLSINKLNLSLSLIGLFWLLLPSSVAAAEFRFDSGEFKLKSSPAGKIGEQILVNNFGDTTKTISFSWEGYSLEEGAYLNSQIITIRSIDFATISPTSLTISPQSTGKVQVTFNVPEKISSGDFYGSLVAKDSESEERLNFTLTVLGKLDEKVEVISTTDNGTQMSLKIANQGNISVPVKASISMHDLLGSKQEFSEETTIRVGEVKEMKFPHPKLKAGFWQQDINLIYGSKNTNYSTLNSFWVNPWIFVIPFALILVALTIVFLFTWRSR